MRGVRGSLVALLVALTAVGCVRGGSGDPTAAGSGSATSGASTDGSAGPSASDDPAVKHVSGTTLGGEIDVAVHPVVVDGGQALLVLDLAVPAGSSSSVDVGAQLMWQLNDRDLSSVRMVDLKAGRVWLPSTDAQGRSAATSLGIAAQPLSAAHPLSAGVMFAAPETTSVDVLIPDIGLVTDVPVQHGSIGESRLSALGLPTSTLTVTPVQDLESFQQAYQQAVSVSTAGQTQTVTLPADVLFASDSDQLNDAATAVVDAAAAQIKAATPGAQVTVIGHTDDVDTAEYNQALSERRATTVGARLGADLGSAYPITTVGKGETEPAVQGTDAAARAANRRVEIQFTSTTDVAVPTTAPVVVPAAAAGVPVGSASQTLTVTAGGGAKGTVAVTSVRRRGAYLVGTLSVTVTQAAGSGSADEARYLLCDQTFDPEPQMEPTKYDRYYGLWSVRLLGTAAYEFPAMHHMAPGDVSSADGDWAQKWVTFLTDRQSGSGQSVGVTVTKTVIWPDADPSETTVSIDSPGRFRFTDVPVVSS